MRKISSYLYPNRIELLADLAGFTTEYTNVYQRTVKIYQGVDNVLEFDIKNADQKRIELLTSPKVTGIELNVMDASGNALPNSPYTVTPHATLKGIATAVIPDADTTDLDEQFLRYSVTATDADGNTIPLYADSRFGAVGTIEIVGSAMPTFRNPKEYKTYTGEIDLDGNVLNHFSAMPVTFYEAVPTQQVDISVFLTGFIGNVWLEGATSDTISVESFRGSEIPNTRHEFTTPFTGEYPFLTADVGSYKYIRVSFQGDNPLTPTGTVDKVVIE
jgi:hypothetical protein